MPTLILAENDIGPPTIVKQIEETSIDLRIINDKLNMSGIKEKIICIAKIFNLSTSKFEKIDKEINLKIDRINQRKKLNALMNLRAQQEFKMFGNEIDLEYSSDNHKINSNFDDTNAINNRINKINFSTEQQKNLQTIKNSTNSGIETSRIIINKNNI